MRKRIRQSFITLLYISIDIFFLYFSIFLACWLRASTLPFPIRLHYLFWDPQNPFRLILFFWILMTIGLNYIHGLYKTKREIFESVEIWQVIRSVILSSLITIVAIYMTKNEDFPRSILIFGSLVIAVALSLWRIGKRILVQYLVSQGYNNFNILIIGAGKVGMTLSQEIHKRPGLGLNIIGFLDDFKTNDENRHGPKIVGKISDFEKIARREFVNKVFITIHHDSKVFLEMLESCKEKGISIQVIPQGFDLIPSDFYKYNIGFIPVLEYSNAENLRKQVGKRLFDFVASLILISILSPVFLILAILIKLDTPGPVFYFSRRYGRRGRIFNMLKFRSMVPNADELLAQLKHRNEVDGPIFKMKEDPRITKFGKFLRKYSIDELPQVLNVLMGDMSLVGPRPFPISQVEKEDLRQLRRLEIRPGMTGLWQIRGRSDSSFSRLVRWDAWYINNWTFGLDLNILLQTIPVVLKGRGAY